MARQHKKAYRFQSTLPVWGATGGYGFITHHVSISIHAPRVGSDELAELRKEKTISISIHAPRVGSDHHYLP